MGLFGPKRTPLKTTAEERQGHWDRQELMAHWWTIPEGMSVAAMSSATDDQLRVLGWDLKSPNQRVLAIVEAKQRRERPDLRKKVEDEGALSAAEFSEWIAPLNALQGRKFIHEPVDQMHEDVFGR